MVDEADGSPAAGARAGTRQAPPARPGAEPVPLRLRPGRQHGVLHGHPWVFSNQLEEVPRDLPPGAEVDVFDHAGGFVGRGYGHPGTLIAARVLERSPGVAIDGHWIEARLRAALDRRRWMLRAGQTALRLVHGEADGLPGLVVDLYGDRLVLAAGTAGMDRMRPSVERAARVLGFASGLWKSDGRGREIEGLAPVVEAGWGDPPRTWEVLDGGLRIAFDPWEGQKTGLFLDMWENRKRMVPALAGGCVLDLFGYVGQWGLQAAAAGAGQVTCVDRSASATEFVRANAARSDLSGRVRAVQARVDEVLTDVPDSSQDAVVCDPPSFIRSRKEVPAGSKAYRTLFAHALRKVRPGGVAVLASCSHHLWEDRFWEAALEAARWAERSLTLLARGGQAPCHPVPAGVPECGYLKCVLVEVGEAPRRAGGGRRSPGGGKG